MYLDRHRNPGRRALHADHSHARILGGTQADRLIHATCNNVLGAALGNQLRGSRAWAQAGDRQAMPAPPPRW